MLLGLHLTDEIELAVQVGVKERSSLGAARASRDMTVPILIPATSAISL
jgi:hypothetical protein